MGETFNKINPIYNTRFKSILREQETPQQNNVIGTGYCKERSYNHVLPIDIYSSWIETTGNSLNLFLGPNPYTTYNGIDKSQVLGNFRPGSKMENPE